jgi:hypothetical protein
VRLGSPHCNLGFRGGGCHVGEEGAEKNSEPLEEKMQRLTTKMEEYAESARLEAAIQENLRRVGR